MGDPTTSDREPEVLGLAVELAPGEPGLGTGDSRLRVHPNALHRREVYDDASVTRRVAGYRVASAAHRHHQFILAGKVHRGGDICNAGAAGDQRQSMVYHRVRVPLSYELSSANVADLSLTEELLAEASFLGEDLARRLLGDLAYRSQQLEENLAELGILLVTEQAKQRRGARQQIEITFASLKKVFGLGETLAKTLVGVATRIATKITAYTYAFLVNRVMGRSQGRIKEVWA